MSNIFQKIFPIPEYLLLPSMSVSVSDRALRYVSLSRAHGQLFLKNMGTITIPEGVMQNGRIINRDGFVEALTRLQKKTSASFVTIAIPDEKTDVCDVEVAATDNGTALYDSLCQALEERGLKAEETSVEYEILNRSMRVSETKAKGKPAVSEFLQIHLSVISKKNIDTCLHCLPLAQLTPLSFATESEAVAASIVPEQDARTFLLIDVRETRTVLSVVSGHIVREKSSLSLGRKDYEKSAHKKALGEAIQKYTGERRIDAILLTGAGATVPGLASFISQHFKGEVSIGDVWTNVCDVNESLPPIDFQESLDFAPAIGLALLATRHA